MEFTELIKIRRSCRSYKKSLIPLEDIEEIIKAAQLAPSWKNSQTGRYYVALSDEAINNTFEMLPNFNQNSTKNAAYIVTSFVKGISGFGVDGPTDNNGDNWGAYDLGLQNAYMLLKASELNYDTLIMGLRDEDKLREYFNIPDEEIVMSVIAIGKKDGDLIYRPRKELKEILKVK